MPNTTPTCASSYIIQQGDTCNSISKTNNIRQDLLITRNNLDYNCQHLVPGNYLCLGDPCKLHIVAQNETCTGILTTLEGYTMQNLTNWNPTIHKTCDNLDLITNRVFCISYVPTQVKENFHYDGLANIMANIILSKKFPDYY
jgi:hypothetical protein